MAREGEIVRMAQQFKRAWGRRGMQGTYLAIHERDRLFEALDEPVEKIPVVASVAVVIREGKLLMALRKDGYCQNQYAVPGGGLHWGATFEVSASDELWEEAGMHAHTAKLLKVYNRVVLEEDHHYVVAFVRIHAHGEPVNVEPDKHGPWEWFDLKDLPENTLPPIKWLVRDYGPDFFTM